MTSLRGRTPVVGFVRDVMPGERFAPVGAVVLGSYWRTRYRVLAHVAHSDWRGESVRVMDLDGPQAGRVREHSTRLDGRDVLLSIPADTGRVHGPEALPLPCPCGFGEPGGVIWRGAEHDVTCPWYTAGAVGPVLHG